MKRMLFVAVAVILSVAMVLGCAGPAVAAGEGVEASRSAGGEENDKQIKLGVSMPTLQSTYNAKMAKIINEYCAELGINVTITDEDYDLSKQVESIENFIAAQCDAIIIVVMDAEGVTDVAQEAINAGIYVMAYDGFIEGAHGSLNVNQYDYGYTTGTLAADWINSNEDMVAQDVIEVGLFDWPQIPIIIDRAEGIIDALTEKCPNVEIVERQAASMADQGVTLGENYLQAHPNMQVIAAINDSAAVGAYEVWAAAGHVGDDIGFFGADADEKALELIAEDTSYRGTVALTAEKSLKQMIDICVSWSKGEEVESVILYGMEAITIDNVQDYIE